ncbi:MAG: pantoate--beta-alanine ligase [Deltaproteobacteria bacterium]|nr:pantoate--beta-alanine ligase [Deltaproteobacteria bacterium]
MKVIISPNQIQKSCTSLKRRGKTIAVVPTMGYLHEGHVTLLKKARRSADILVLTIFVNPTQFGPKEDFKRYPRDPRGDLAKARRAGVDYVFMPRMEAMYPEGFETYVEVTRATQELCGRSRPDHFRGVTTIVAKLFNLIQPDIAFFGKKDFQQFAVLKRMVKDLNMPIQMVGVDTVREKDGLAMSSRNVYLSPVERKAALCLFRGLKKTREAVRKGEKNLGRLLSLLKNEIRREKSARIDYVTCVSAESIQPINKYQKGETLFAVAVFIGKTRLIDNVVV